MKNKTTYVLIFFLTMMFFFNCSNIYSQVPRLLSYQGQLLDKNNQPYNGFVSIEFSLFLLKFGGSSIWSEVQNINVENGYFSVFLGRNNQFGKDLQFDKQYYLEVSLNNNQMKYERAPLMSSPYSFRSDYSDSSNVAKKVISLEDGSVKLSNLSSEVLTLGGDLIGTLPNPRINPEALTNNIPDFSITKYKLAPNSVIFNGSNASGDLEGTYPGPFIANGAVNNNKLSANSITSDKIKDFSILRSDLNSEVLSGDVIFTNITATNSVKSPNNFLTNIVGTSSTFVNEKVTNSNISSLTAGITSSTISINSPVASFSTSLTSPLVYFGNTNVNTLSSGTSSASISVNSPLGNFTNLNSTNVSSTFVNSNNIITPNLKATDLTASKISSTLSINTPQLNSPQANFTNLTVGVLSSTLTNTIGVASSGTIVAGQGLDISNGGINIVGNAKLNGNLAVRGLSTHSDNVINNKEVLNQGKVTNNSDVLNNANMSVLGNTQIGDAFADKFIINAETIFNQNIRFPAGLSGISAKINDIIVGTASATTSIITPYAKIDNASMNGLSANNFSTSLASVTISLRTPHVFADTTDINSIIARTASVTVSVRTPQLWNAHGDITRLDAGWVSSTVTNDIGIRASGTISIDQGLTVKSGGTNLTGRLEQHGQTTIYGNGDGSASNFDDYALRVQSTNQGIAIKVNGSRNSDKNFVDFRDDSKSWGRIQGETHSEMINSAEYIVSLATKVGAELVAVVDAFNAGAKTTAAGLDIRACTGFGAVVCPPGVGIVVTEGSTWVSKIAAAVAATADLVSFITFKEETNGITFTSGAGDYAEFLKKKNVNEIFLIGDIVGMNGGEISRNTTNSEKNMVVSLNPIVLGNTPKVGYENEYEKVAFLGQVPVKVMGKVKKGDYIIPNGLNNGFGFAINPEDMKLDDYQKIVGVAWSDGISSDFNVINISVGLNQNDAVKYIINQSKSIEKLKKELNETKVKNNVNNLALAKLVPNYNPILEVINNTDNKDNKQLDTSHINDDVTNSKLSNTNDVKESIGKTIENNDIGNLNITPEIIIKAIDLAVENYEKSETKLKFHPFYSKIKSDVNYKNEIVNLMMYKAVDNFKDMKNFKLNDRNYLSK
ncbi:MAG: hypothetical protein NTW25_05005 [Candidatus Kapabacteria bacterium]|nr:hypothetical protein [Candidatus Kapabacteria bacterium]